MTVKKVVQNFMECSSLNSLPFIVTAPNVLVKVLWTCIILSGTGAMLFHLSYVVKTYLDYETTTGIKFKNSNLTFPDILICNKNTVRKSMINSLTDDSFIKFLTSFTNASTGKSKKPIQSVINVTNPLGKKGTSWSQNVRMRMRRFYGSEKMSIRKKVGHQIQDMLINCEFNGESCSARDFRLKNTMTYGNCFFFDPKQRIINTPGSENGLQLQFFLQGDEFIPYLGQYGLQVLVSVPHSIAFPDDLGIYASSSFKTRISIRQNNIIRKGGLYGTCNDSSIAKLGKENYIYTFYACNVLCEIEYGELECGCVIPADMDYDHYMKDESQTKLCNISQSICVGNAKEKVRNSSVSYCSKRCYNPCNETTYGLTVSTQSFPDIYQTESLVNFMCMQNTSSCDYLRKRDFPQQRLNFAALNIFYDNMQYTLYQESASYGTVSFASDFGGTMGLWIGISALTIVEILYFLVCLGRATIKALLREPKTTPVELDTLK